MALWFYNHRPKSGLTEFLENRKKGWQLITNQPNDDGELLGTDIQEGDYIIAHGGDWEIFAKEHSKVEVFRITVGGTGLEKTNDISKNYRVSEKSWELTADKLKLKDRGIEKTLQEIEEEYGNG